MKRIVKSMKETVAHSPERGTGTANVAQSTQGKAIAAATVEKVHVDGTAKVHALAKEMTGRAFVPIFDFIEKTAEMKEELAASPLVLRFRLEDAGFDLASLPEVGAKTGNNPEVVMAWDTEKQKEVEVNAFTILFADTPVAKKWAEQIESLKLAMKPETAKQSKHHADMAHDTAYLDDELSKYSQRMTSGRNLFRKCAQLYQKEIALENTEGVVIRYNTYKDKNGDDQIKETSRYPYRLHDAGDLAVYKPLTIGDLIKLNVAKAKELVKASDGKRSMYLCLLDTLAREAKPEGKGGQPVVDSIDKLHDAIAAANSYLDPDGDETDTRIAALDKHLASKKGDEMVLQIALTFHTFEPLYKKVQKRAERLLSEASEKGVSPSELLKQKQKQPEQAAA